MTKAERLTEMENQVKELQNNIATLQKEVEKEKNKFTIEGFKSGEFVVHCKTQYEADIFCAYLAGVGEFTVNIGLYKLAKHWEIYEKDTCFSCGYFNKNELGYSSKRFYENNGITVIEFNTDMLK